MTKNNHIARRLSRRIQVGSVAVGGSAPISVQSMTNTPSEDVNATLKQIRQIAEAGADLVRVSCPSEESTKALKLIVKDSPIPVIADIHFHYKRAIEAAQAGAHGLRFNPGNIGDKHKISETIKAARDNGVCIRIGVNAGSLEKRLLEKYREPCAEAMVESALQHARLLEDSDFYDFKISVKASDIFMACCAYRQLAEACDYPLHVGITEAGGMRSGVVKSALGIGSLLWEGIGDTIRVSLSADPVEEVKVAFDILKALGLRRRGVNIIACPSCSRQQFDVISTVAEVEARTAHITTPIDVSIIGCVVNGPGEALVADIGFSGGGRGTHQVYMGGRTSHRLKNDSVAEHLTELIEAKAAEITTEKSKLHS